MENKKQNFSISSANNVKNDQEIHLQNYLQCLNPEASMTNLFSKENKPTMYFTKREIECAHFLLQGKTTKEIARIMEISPRTIEIYLGSLRAKTGCKNRSKLLLFLLKQLT